LGAWEGVPIEAQACPHRVQALASARFSFRLFFAYAHSLLRASQRIADRQGRHRAGWAHRRRDHGGVIFVDLRDREGLLQIVFDPDKAAVFAMAERVRNEFVLKVTGLVRVRRRAPRTPT